MSVVTLCVCDSVKRAYRAQRCYRKPAPRYIMSSLFLAHLALWCLAIGVHRFKLLEFSPQILHLFVQRIELADNVADCFLAPLLDLLSLFAKLLKEG